MKKLLAVSLSLIMMLSPVVTAIALTQGGNAGKAQTKEAEYVPTYLIEKLTNPETGSGEADGLNTNDETGFEANRYNSYAWAMEELGGYLYVGTNRNLYGAAIASIAMQMSRTQELTYEEAVDKVENVANLISGGAVPDIRDMEADDWIPQIIRINPTTGDTKVIYQPDMEGINPETEACSFRSVVKFNNKLYFGSMGATRLQVVCVDADENAEAVYTASAIGSSLRACTVWDNTVVFGGLDSALTPSPDSEYAGMHPMVIRAMNPEDDHDWSTIIADYRDFVPYADESVYANAGGTVWDLVTYNNKLYAILASDDGFVMFAGEKATTEQIENGEANDYGYIWSTVIGEGGTYNAGMAETEEGLNHGENDTLGTKDSTATPYVYNDKLYIGTFDNSTSIMLKTVMKLMARMSNPEGGPSLSDIYREMYNAATNPQKMYCMNENEEIVPVTDLNNQLSRTLDDYIWRMKEYDGKLYTTTFDPSILWSYFTSISNTTIISAPLQEEAQSMVAEIKTLEKGCKDSATDMAHAQKLVQIAVAYAALVDEYLAEQITLEELAEGIEALQSELDELILVIENEDLLSYAQALKGVMNAADVEGMKMIIDINRLATTSEQGFSLYVSTDGEYFKEIMGDGCDDKYNYGGRTLAVCGDSLYVGTANPFYGAQIWKVDEIEEPTPPETEEPTPPESEEPTPPESEEPSTPPESEEPTPPESEEPTPPESEEPTPPESEEPTPPESEEPTAPVLEGDVNGDGDLNTGDAVSILRHAASLATLTEEQLQNADVNGDGTVNTGDAVTILRYLVGLIPEL